ncbi:nucleotide excision repair endonuclease [candidate division KSB1 bacterium]|nr:nucleotide excision repair endonuclease [candidate division KSB1 bacterium]
MIEKISNYLMEQPQPVSAFELAERFLKLQKTNLIATEKIMTAILQKHPQFSQTETGWWTIKEIKTDSELFRFVICKIFPETTPRFRMFSISLATFNKDTFCDTMCYRVDYDAEKLLELCRQVENYVGNLPVFFDGFGNQRSNFSWLLSYAAPRHTNRPFFSLVKIVKKLLPTSHITSPDELSSFLLGTYQTGGADVQFENYKKQVLQIIELLRENGITRLDSLHLLLSASAPVDFSQYAFDENFLSRAPTCPGVYVMQDKAGQIIYVGKAVNLKRRLSTYFSAVADLDEKLKKIRQNLYDMQIIHCGSELEALLLEHDYIQKYRPHLNSQVDVHTRQNLVRERYPQILFLPSAAENKIKVIFFHPANHVILRDVNRDGSNVLELKQDVEALLDISAHSSENEVSAKTEILTSWLSQNSDHANSIDMRSVTSVREALRLVREYVMNFDPCVKHIFL